MLSGDNGLLKRAGDSRDETIVGQEKEQVELAYVSAAVKNLGGNVTGQNLQDELDNSVGQNKTKVTGSGTLKVKFEDTKNEYKVATNGTVTKYESIEPTDVYATVCANGTLIFSNNESDINKYLTNNSTTIASGYSIENITNKTYYYDLNEDKMVGPPWYNNEDETADENITKVNFINTVAPKNTANWMNGLNNLTTIDNINNLNTSNVTDMSGMFCECANLTNLNVTGFDTSKVTDMSGMFSDCPITNLNLNSFDTSNVTNMSGMFGNCFSLTSLDLSNFNTENVTDMNYMFGCCDQLTNLNLRGFDTRKVTNMSAMFYCNSNMETLDISSFNTSNVTDMTNMFANSPASTSIASSLMTIYVSDDFITTNVNNSTSMFYDCISLRGENNTTYNSSYTDKTYARIDTASTPGYFTLKTN